MPDLDFHEHDCGLSWVLREPMRRACHALAADGRVWLVDPVGAPEALDRAAALGEPAAVLQLLDRHARDCAAIAQRLGVPHLTVPDGVPDSPFVALPALRIPRWAETALWWPDRGALVVAETLGTAPLFTAGQGAVGMHPLLRPWPPRALRDRHPEHLLVGHGAPVHGLDARTGPRRAHDRARRDIPRVLRMLPGAVRG